MILYMRFHWTLLGGWLLSAFLRPLPCVLAAACLVVCGGLQQAWASTSATATMLAVTSGGNMVTTVASGGVITLTATVMAGSNALTQGQVNFCDATAAHCTDVHLLGTAQLTSRGMAVLKVIPGVGTRNYKAVFVGTTSYAASSSDWSGLVVVGTGLYPTIATIAPSGAAGNYSLTATVTGNGGVLPTGSVSFLDTSVSSYVLGTAVLSPRVAGLSFANSSNPGASSPTFVVAADFNGDGIPDLALTVNFGYGLTVLLGNGQGGFTAAGSPPTSFKPDFVAVGDFDGDGIPDLAVANDQLPSVTVLLGNGDGTFRAGQALETGSYCLSVAVGDFNGDGKLDLAVTNFSRPEELMSSDVDTVSILLGNGDGTFIAAAGNSATGSIPVSSVVADFDGDGKPDLAVANYGSDTVTILLSNGDGTFTAAASRATGSEPTSVAEADFNGDGRADLAVTDSGSDTVTILLGNGDGTFTAGASPGKGSKPSFVAVQDFNGDGKPDLAVTNSDSNTVTVLLGNGDGTFTEAVSPATGTNPLSVAVGDFNGDGKADLAVANLTDNAVTVLLTETGSATATVNNLSPVGAGTHLVDASYPGDSNYKGSISGTVPLTAAATGPMPSFALSNTAVSIPSPGASGTSTITVIPAGGFTGSVALTCAITGGPAAAINAPTCSAIAPAAISGAAAVTATLTINTIAASTASPYVAALGGRLKRFFKVEGSLAISALLFFGLPALGQRWKTLLPLVVFAAIAGAAIGCGSGSNPRLSGPTRPGTTIGMYTVTVTGISGAATATTVVSVTVN
jgi:hypothetical protein